MVACIVVGLLAVHLPQRPFVKFVYSSRGSTCASALREIDGWAGSAGTAAEPPAAVGAGHVLGIPSALASFQGPAASAQYKLVSLADTFSQELADAFHASGSFRTALIGCAPDLTVLFKAGTSLEQTADSTSEEDKEGCRGRLGDVLRLHVGARAPTADEFVGNISALCGDHWGGFTSFESKEPPPGALEWHQDWAAADMSYAFDACRSVMLAFPAKGSTDHEGEGILTELVQLSHEFSTESLKKSEGYGGMSTGEQDRKAASDLGVSDEHIVRPRYGRGQEILVYKDAEHLHRSPRATSDPAGRAREAIWRLQ